MIAKLVAYLFLIASTFGVAAFTMIHGWGISPASWGWIVGGWIIQLLLMGIAEAIKISE